MAVVSTRQNHGGEVREVTRDSSSTTEATGAASYYTDGGWWSQRRGYRSTYKVRLVMEMLGDVQAFFQPGFKGAEIGCGNGSFLLPLAEELDRNGCDYQLTGYDIAPNAIAMAREDSADNPRLQFELGSADAPAERLDAVFLLDVLEHVENPYEFLRQVCEKAERVIVHLPLEQSWAHLLMKRPSRSFERFRHIHFFSWTTARILFEVCGCRIERYQFTGATRESVRMAGGWHHRLMRRVRYWLFKCLPELTVMLAGGSVLAELKPKVKNDT